MLNVNYSLSATLPSLPPAHCDHLFLFASTKILKNAELCKQNYSLNLLLSSCFKLYKVMPNYLRLYLVISEIFCTFAVPFKSNT